MEAEDEVDDELPEADETEVIKQFLLMSFQLHCVREILEIENIS